MSALVCHERTHTNERPYSCSVCRQRFKYLGDKNKHERRHESLGGSGFKRIVPGRNVKPKVHAEDSSGSEPEQGSLKDSANQQDAQQITEEQYEEQQEEQYDQKFPEEQIVKFEQGRIVKFEGQDEYEQVYEQVRVCLQLVASFRYFWILLSARKFECRKQRESYNQWRWNSLIFNF